MTDFRELLGAGRHRIVLRSRIMQSARHARDFHRKVLLQPYARKLTSGDKRSVLDYSNSVLGSPIFQPWLRFYCAVHGFFREGWIPDDFYGLVALPVVNGHYRTISNAKSLSRRILASENIPDLAYFTNGVWFDVAGTPIPRGLVKDVLASATPVVVVKLENSNQGRGVFCIPVSELDISSIETWGRLVVQKYIHQHELLESLSPGCVATLRITTGLESSGTAKVLGSYLRMGQAGAQVIKSAEALKAIVARDGHLDQFAYAPDYKRHLLHPDTGVRFAGVVVPSYAAAASLCVSLHEKVPQFMIVGWDVGIGADGDVQVIEWNTDHPDIKFVEAVGGPHLTPLGLEAHAKRRQFQ